MNEDHDISNRSLRETKKRKAQTDIEEAALRLFLEKGYEQTSIKDITDEVMMSSRTFFRYFTSKEEVLTGFTQTTQKERMEQMDSNASVQQALRSIFSLLSQKYEQQRQNLLTRYHISKQTESISSLFLYKLLEPEPLICEELCSHIKGANRDRVRFLVAIHMAAFRVSVEIWLEDTENKSSLKDILFNHLDQFKDM